MDALSSVVGNLINSLVWMIWQLRHFWTDLNKESMLSTVISFRTQMLSIVLTSYIVKTPKLGIR